LSIETRIPSEENFNTNKHHNLLSPRLPQASPRLKYNLLSELSTAQSHISRLRRDRNKWRSLAQKQEQDLITAHQTLEQQTHRISKVEAKNAQHKRQHEEDISAGKQVYSRFQTLATSHDKLVDQVNDSLRTITQLKKSDRSKGEVQQRNLRLKATLKCYTLQGTSAIIRAADDTEATLREALALANERIEELESTGEALLDALDKRNDSCGSEVDEMEEAAAELTVLEAEVTFHGVREDDVFREQRELLDG
jgi:DNA repair exonuclease SbcCD ATPase subunit